MSGLLHVDGLSWALLAGGGLGAAICIFVVAVRPPRTDLAAAVGRWESRRSRQVPAKVQADRSPQQRVAAWLSSEATERGWAFTKLRADLALLDRTFEEHLVTKMMWALVGFMFPAVLSLICLAEGITPPFTLTVGMALALAAVFFFMPDTTVAREAADRREQLRRALSCFLDLVAMSLAGGRGVPEALPSAAGIGRGWAFELLADTIGYAPYAGQTPWAALRDLGERTGMQELLDLGNALTLVADDGAKVRESLSARAATQRRRQLAEAQGEAQRASQSMNLSQLLLAAGFLGLIGYPAVVAILVI